jgi:hypothetical protein
MTLSSIVARIAGHPYLPHESCSFVLLLLGWATYENNRGFGWYEALNPSEAFGDIMIDYSYVECSMACLTALYEFHQRHPNTRSREVKHSLATGRDFLKSIQREVSQASNSNPSTAFHLSNTCQNCQGRILVRFMGVLLLLRNMVWHRRIGEER